MASAAVIPSGGAAAAAAEPNGWVMDERDGFISWLRGEFAAANAIIDLLVVHLRAVGDPGEYDHVFGAVQQRRHHWTSVIHMQQFFPVADVAYALQQSGWRRRAPPAQQHGPGVSPSPPPPPSRRPSFSPSHSYHRHGGHHRSDPFRGGGNVTTAGSEKDGREVHNKDGKGLKEVQNVVDAKSLRLNSLVTDECEKSPRMQVIAEGNSKVTLTPVEYTTNEIIDGKPVNTVEGLKVYEGLVNVTETNKILSLVNETKASGRRGFEGQTVIIGKRPLKGHGSIIIQLGIPVIDGSLEDGNQRETVVEAVPGLLHDLFDRLVQQGIVPLKPDYCVIDYFREGEYSHPQQPPSWYGRPLCTLCLTECDMVFGRVILGERGDLRGPLKISLSTGSLIVLQGRSADVAKRAIPATRKQRILLTFGKYVARKHIPSESTPRFTPLLTPPPLPWGPSSRPVNMRPHSPSPKHFAYTPSAANIGPHHIPPSDGMQPIFIAPAPVAAAAIPFPAAVPLPNTTAAWAAEAAPRPAPPRFPIPGTGVFLPPGSASQLPHQMIQASHTQAEPNSPHGSSASVHKGAGMEMSNGNASPRSSPTAKRSNTVEVKPECNGTSNDGCCIVEKSGVTQEQQNGGKNDGTSNGGCGIVEEKSSVSKVQQNGDSKEQQDLGKKNDGNSKVEPNATK